jgi:hypothetical protein
VATTPSSIVAQPQRIVVKNKRVAIEQNRSSAISLWNYDSIRSAIAQQCNGIFSGTCRLARSMMTDSAFSASILKRVHGLIHSDLSFEGNEEAAQLLDECWPMLTPETELTKVLIWFHLVGVGLAQIITTHSDDVWTTRLEVLSPEFLRYDIYQKKWIYSSLNGDIDVNPGDGQWILISQYDPSLPCGYVSLFGEDWAQKKFALRSWISANDASGYPIVIGRTPAEVAVEVKSEFLADLSDAQNTKVVICPEGFDVEVLSAPVTTSTQGSSDLVDRIDRKFQIGINGGNLSSEMASGGSYAAAQVHKGNEVDLIKSDAAVVSTALQEQLFSYFIQYNIDGTTRCPFPAWDLSEPVDEQATMTAMNTAVGILAQLSTLGYTVDNIVEVMKSVGLEISPKVTT